ncbi:MFS transporter [Homoserinibacter sp. YIM 151385]|uniref:MFS transporter n=1 Tax=Homoserinibacter sp. YIM 151385 TaxID=2985506 RepID=UPI0022F12EB2|nr:MFS transporter [Homoserinibacter sp. YIM 151385]WBU38342.1 MFS transporter [Homoserinibacter sp. YIM 151385]
MTGVPGDSPAQRWVPVGVALAGVLLASANLRTAVAGLSPVLDRVAEDIDVPALLIGLLGATPPLAFALGGVIAPALARRLGIEMTLVISLGAMVLGHLGRAVAPESAVLVLGSFAVLAGIGTATVLMPPLVKRYFPDRVGGMTAVYATVMAIGATIPPLVAVPLADAAGWRVSLGIWAVAVLLAVPPWILAVAGNRRRLAHLHDEAATGSIELPPARLRVERSRVAWAITAIFTVSSLTAYTVFGWLPTILVDVAGIGEAEAGALVALFAAMGIPIAFIAPVLASRMRSVAPLVLLSVALGVAGGGGLLIAPTAAPWLWVALLGLAPLLFPLAMYLMGARTDTAEGAVAVSGFVNRAGYIIAAAGPLLIGVLHDATGGWAASLALMTGWFLFAIPAAVVLHRPRSVEEELAGR